MNTEEIKSYYLKEFSLFDGEFDITFNILDVNTDKMTITVAVTRAGKIFVTECELQRDKEQDLYFQFTKELKINLTLINIKHIKASSDNKLTKKVCSYLIDKL